MVPELSHSSVYWAHIYRYRFAARLVRNKRVLDIACGEGYGSAGLLAAGASDVIPMDISERTVRHVARKYGLNAIQGSAEAISLSDQSVDVVVSFETIEHLRNPRLFVQECARVLKSDGTLIVSSPNRDGATGAANPHHSAEMNIPEFSELIRCEFPRCQIYGQWARTAAWWTPRSLAAERSGWSRVPGAMRVRNRLRLLWRVKSVTEPSESLRDRSPEVIAASRLSWCSVLDPCVIRRFNPGQREVPAFMVAVARRTAP
jgi:SAM-dependent methyltransferase